MDMKKFVVMADHGTREGWSIQGESDDFYGATEIWMDSLCRGNSLTLIFRPVELVVSEKIEVAEPPSKTGKPNPHTFYVCPPDCIGCSFCDGDLKSCTVCKGAEGTLTTECCGRPMTEEESRRVYTEGTLNFIGGAWVEGAWINYQWVSNFKGENHEPQS